MAIRKWMSQLTEVLGMTLHRQEERLIPLLPLRGLLVFPAMVLHLDVGREKSIKALEKAMVNDNEILLSCQEKMQKEEPDTDDIFRVGTVARVRQMLKLPNGTIRVLVEGLYRARILRFVQTDPYFEVAYEEMPEEYEADAEIEALMRAVLEHFEHYSKLSKKITPETFASVMDVEEPGRLADVITSHLTLKIRDKQTILETVSVKERLMKLLDLLNNESEVLELERQIQQRVKKQIERSQKEYYLREQMKAIQKELGDKEGRMAEVEEIRQKMEQVGELPEKVREKIEKELDRLEKMTPAAAEGTGIRTYLDWLLDLPWTKRTKDELDIRQAQVVLDEAHYGLEKAKERILEYLAVQKRVNHLKGPILCLVGPPGVGKTSLARSVAEAMGRKFVRVSLGGVRDEAEIRGHRRTYVGAMPGRIIQGMKTAGTVNPVFLLDEIDKMSSDFRGDPAAAMLEVLDPEQNHQFSDHYIELPYDLSQVLFIATANNAYNIPRPLLDRMEILHLSGYTEDEKLHIAKRHLLPKQMKEHGLAEGQLVLDDDVILQVIRQYTREAGVRNLERQLATLCRKATKQLVTDESLETIEIRADNLKDYLGTPRYRYGLAEERDLVGAATGLAWTEAGGDTLIIEVSTFPGKGRLILTGKLGEVMKESAQAAFSYIRSRAAELKVDKDFTEKLDIHIHVPEGAIPKDGPSAGITMATALISALTGIPVSKDVGMTGEITLRGRVLPIGGLKEKMLAAHRAGLKRVLFPRENLKDVEEIPENVRKSLTLIPVEHMDQVLKEAFLENPLKQQEDWSEAVDAMAAEGASENSLDYGAPL